MPKLGAGAQRSGAPIGVTPANWSILPANWREPRRPARGHTRPRGPRPCLARQLGNVARQLANPPGASAGGPCLTLDGPGHVAPANWSILPANWREPRRPARGHTRPRGPRPCLARQLGNVARQLANPPGASAGGPCLTLDDPGHVLPANWRIRAAGPVGRRARSPPGTRRCRTHDGEVSTNKSSQGRADAQRLVATRLLDRLHDPLGHFSRLQRIYPRAR